MNFRPDYIKIVHLEVTFKDHKIQLSDHFRSNKKLKHIIENTESIIQIPLEYWQTWCINQLSRFEHPYSKEIFP